MTSEPDLAGLRLLILAPCQADQSTVSPSPFPPLLSALTSISPSSDLETFAGYTSHPPLHLKTRYYERHVGVWCDELPPVRAPGTRSRASTADTAATRSPILGSATSPSKPSVTFGDETVASPISPFKPETSLSSPVQNDLVPEEIDTTQQSSTLKEWKEQMLSPIASEVLSSIGAIILILAIPSDERYPSTPQQKVELMEYMSAVNEIKDAIEDVGRDVGSLFLLQPANPAMNEGKEKAKMVKRLEGLVEIFEDKSHEMGIFGWDLVWWDGVSKPISEVPQNEVEASTPIEPKKDPAPRNEYGEKLGIERVREVLEGVDWSVSPLTGGTGGDEVDELDEDDKFDVFGGQQYKGLDAELQREMMGLKLSVMNTEEGNDTSIGEEEGQDISIDQMSALMERVVAIREAGSDLERDEREKFAKREVEKIMQEIG